MGQLLFVMEMEVDRPSKRHHTVSRLNQYGRIIKLAYNYGRRLASNAGKPYPYPPKRQMGGMPKGTAYSSVGTRIYKAGRYNSGKSAGKLKVKRPLKKLRKQKRAVSRGVEQTREAVGSSNALYCQYIGHANQPVNMVKDLMWLAIAKWIAIKCTGGGVASATQPIAAFAPGVNFNIKYRITPTAGLTTQVVTIPAATQWSMKDLAYNLDMIWDTICVPENQTVLCGIDSTNSNPPFNLELTNARMRVYAKSTLKIQNRSYGGGGTEEDDVDNVPLYGKSYQFRGNGTDYMGGTTSVTVGGGVVRPLYANNTTGLFAFGVAGLIDVNNSEDLGEPPAAFCFRGVRKHDKVRIEPGHIKTSTLVDSYTISLQNLITMCGFVDSNPSKNQLGKFRLFALEKILETSNPPIVEIRTAFENQTRMSMELLPGYTMTRSMFVPYQA